MARYTRTINDHVVTYMYPTWHFCDLSLAQLLTYSTLIRQLSICALDPEGSFMQAYMLPTSRISPNKIIFSSAEGRDVSSPIPLAEVHYIIRYTAIKLEAKDVLPNKLHAGCPKGRKMPFLFMVTLTFDLDFQTRPSEGPNIFRVNVAQISSAVPEIFHTQTKNTD